MKKSLVLKVNGTDLKSLLLTFELVRLDFEVYYYNVKSLDELPENKLNCVVSIPLKNLLVKYNLWNKLQKHLCSFDSFSIKDEFINEDFHFSISEMQPNVSSLGVIGWTVPLNIFTDILLEGLNKYNNFKFISNNKISSIDVNYDLEFIKNERDFTNNISNFIPILNISNDQSILYFDVIVRGNLNKRLYEFNTKKGCLLLVPKNDNSNQIIWISSTSELKDKLNSSKSFILDNLSAILPCEIKIDQIIGDINIIPLGKSLNEKKLVPDLRIIIDNLLNNYTIKVNNRISFYIFLLKDILFNLWNKNSNDLLNFNLRYLRKKVIHYLSIFNYFNNILIIFPKNSFFSNSIRKLLFITLNKNSFFRVQAFNFKFKIRHFKL